LLVGTGAHPVVWWVVMLEAAAPKPDVQRWCTLHSSHPILYPFLLATQLTLQLFLLLFLFSRTNK
jgi:hypothetical protein